MDTYNRIIYVKKVKSTIKLEIVSLSKKNPMFLLQKAGNLSLMAYQEKDIDLTDFMIRKNALKSPL